MGSEKPTDELQAGQRRRSTCTNGVLLSGQSFTLIEMHTDGRWKYLYDGHAHAYYRDAADIPKYSIVAPGTSPGPQPGKVRAAMGEKRDGLPLLCLNCGERDPGAGMYHCLTCMEPAAFSSRAQRRKEWRAGARDFPRPRSSQGEPGATLELDALAAPAATPKPVKREVFAGGAWLPYEKLTDPDPFEAYRHRRENGVVAAVVEAPSTRVVGCYTSDKQVEYGTEKTIAEAMSGRRRKSSSLTLTPWLATDSKPPQQRAYRTPSGRGR